jgi:hypothetical protein
MNKIDQRPNSHMWPPHRPACHAGTDIRFVIQNLLTLSARVPAAERILIYPHFLVDNRLCPESFACSLLLINRSGQNFGGPGTYRCPIQVKLSSYFPRTVNASAPMVQRFNLLDCTRSSNALTQVSLNEQHLVMKPFKVLILGFEQSGQVIAFLPGEGVPVPQNSKTAHDVDS